VVCTRLRREVSNSGVYPSAQRGVSNSGVLPSAQRGANSGVLPSAQRGVPLYDVLSRLRREVALPYSRVTVGRYSCSLYNSAFCSGFLVSSAPLSRFTVGQERRKKGKRNPLQRGGLYKDGGNVHTSQFPFHCWLLIGTVHTLLVTALLPSQGRLILINVDFPDSRDVRTPPD